MATMARHVSLFRSFALFSFSLSLCLSVSLSLFVDYGTEQEKKVKQSIPGDRGTRQMGEQKSEGNGERD